VRGRVVRLRHRGESARALSAAWQKPRMDMVDSAAGVMSSAECAVESMPELARRDGAYSRPRTRAAYRVEPRPRAGP